MAPTPSEITDVIKATLQLSEQLMKLGKGYLNLTKSIGNTHREIDDFGKTCIAFSDDLYLFHNEVLETHRQGYTILQAHHTQALVADVWKLGKGSVRPAKESLRRLQSLREEESLTTLVGAKLRWALRDRQILRKLQVNIEPIRLHTLQLAKAFRLHICRSDVRKLQAGGHEVPEQSIAQLSTLIKLNKRLKREGRAACQQFEEQYFASNATSSNTDYSPKYEILIDFVKGVQDITRHEYKTGQELLAELTWVSVKLPGTVSSLLDLTVDVDKPRRRSKDEPRSRNASKRRRWTEPSNAHLAPKRTQNELPGTALTSTSSLHVGPLSISAARGIKTPSATPPPKKSHAGDKSKSGSEKNDRDGNPARSSKSSRKSSKTTKEPNNSTVDVQKIPTAKPEPVNSTPAKTPTEVVTPAPSQNPPNFFEIDAEGNFHLDSMPIGNARSPNRKALAVVRANITTTPSTPHTDNGDNDGTNGSRASSEFAPSSIYNCMDDELDLDHNLTLPDSASASASDAVSHVFSRAPSVASWEDWTDSEDEHSADDMDTHYHRDARDRDRDDMVTTYHRDAKGTAVVEVADAPENVTWDAKYGDHKRMAQIVFRRLMEEIRPR